MESKFVVTETLRFADNTDLLRFSRELETIRETATALGDIR